MRRLIPEISDLEFFGRTVGVIAFGGIGIEAVISNWAEDKYSAAFKLFYALAFSIAFAVRKRPKSTDFSASAAGITLLHCLLPLIYDFTLAPIIPLKVGLILILIGLTMSAISVLDLWSSFGVLAANRGIVKSGLYRVVRHPIYTGYILTALGWTLISFTFLNVTLFIAFIILTALRIHFEERHLILDRDYVSFSKSTTYRLLPGIY